MVVIHQLNRFDSHEINKYSLTGTSNETRIQSSINRKTRKIIGNYRLEWSGWTSTRLATHSLDLLLFDMLSPERGERWWWVLFADFACICVHNKSFECKLIEQWAHTHTHMPAVGASHAAESVRQKMIIKSWQRDKKRRTKEKRIKNSIYFFFLTRKWIFLQKWKINWRRNMTVHEILTYTFTFRDMQMQADPSVRRISLCTQTIIMNNRYNREFWTCFSIEWRKNHVESSLPITPPKIPFRFTVCQRERALLLWQSCRSAFEAFDVYYKHFTRRILTVDIECTGSTGTASLQPHRKRIQ